MKSHDIRRTLGLLHDSQEWMFRPHARSIHHDDIAARSVESTVVDFSVRVTDLFTRLNFFSAMHEIAGEVGGGSVPSEDPGWGVQLLLVSRDEQGRHMAFQG